MIALLGGCDPFRHFRLLRYGVYILHDEKDDNVPVAQARFMRELLGEFHPDFARGTAPR